MQKGLTDFNLVSGPQKLGYISLLPAISPVNGQNETVNGIHRPFGFLENAARKGCYDVKNSLCGYYQYRTRYRIGAKALVTVSASPRGSPGVSEGITEFARRTRCQAPPAPRAKRIE